MTPIAASGQPDRRFQRRVNHVAQGHREGKRALLPFRPDDDVLQAMQARSAKTNESMNSIINELCRKGCGL